MDASIRGCILMLDTNISSPLLRKSSPMSPLIRREEQYQKIIFSHAFDSQMRWVCSELLNSTPNAREWMIKAVKRKGSSLKSMNNRWYSDEEIVHLALMGSPSNATSSCIGESLRNNREWFLEIVKVHGRLLKFASFELRSDREIVLEAIRSDREAVQHVTDKYLITNDQEIVKLMLGKSIDEMDFERDRKEIVGMVKGNSHILKSSKLAIHNKSLMLDLVQQFEDIYEMLDEKLVHDLEIIERMLIAFPDKLPFVAIQNWEVNTDLLLRIVKKQHNIVKFIPERVMNRDFALMVVKRNGLSLQHLQFFHQDIEIILAAVGNKWHAFDYIPPEVSYDEKNILQILNSNIMCILRVDSRKIDRFTFTTHTKQLLEQYPELFYQVDYSFRQDWELVERILSKNPIVLAQVQFSSSIYSRIDHQILMAAIRKDKNAFSMFISPEKNNLNFILACVKQNPHVYTLLPQSFKNNKQVVRESIRRDETLLGSAPIEILKDKDLVLEMTGYEHLSSKRLVKLGCFMNKNGQ